MHSTPKPFSGQREAQRCVRATAGPTKQTNPPMLISLSSVGLLPSGFASVAVLAELVGPSSLSGAGWNALGAHDVHAGEAGRKEILRHPLGLSTAVSQSLESTHVGRRHDPKPPRLNAEIATRAKRPRSKGRELLPRRQSLQFAGVQRWSLPNVDVALRNYLFRHAPGT